MSWYCRTSHDVSWCFMICHGIAGHFMMFHDVSWYVMVLQAIPWCFRMFHEIVYSCLSTAWHCWRPGVAAAHGAPPIFGCRSRELHQGGDQKHVELLSLLTKRKRKHGYMASYDHFFYIFILVVIFFSECIYIYIYPLYPVLDYVVIRSFYCFFCLKLQAWSTANDFYIDEGLQWKTCESGGGPSNLWQLLPSNTREHIGTRNIIWEQLFSWLIFFGQRWQILDTGHRQEFLRKAASQVAQMDSWHWNTRRLSGCPCTFGGRSSRGKRHWH